MLMTLYKYSHFSGMEDSNKQIASRLLLHLREIEKASLQEVADLCYVSAATVSRFIRSAGYGSYAQFRQALVYELNHYAYLSLSNVAGTEDLNTTIESYIEASVVMAHRLSRDLDRETLLRMADALYESRAVYVFSFFLPSSLPYLLIDLGLSGKPCEICELEVDQHRVIREIGPGDFLLAIKAQEADSRYMEELIRQAKQQGAQVGMILNAEGAPILDTADYPLCFPGTNSPVDAGVLNDCVTLLSIAYRKKYLNL